jgi:hemerythrin
VFDIRGLAVTVLIWNPAWDTGIALIDEQHRNLVAQFEGLLVAIHENRPDIHLPELLGFLAEYVEVHFSTEEWHMKAAEYPELARHKASHDGLRARVLQLVAGYHQDPAAMTEEVINFLTDLLVGHIQDHDQSMARFFVHVNAAVSRARP